ncbi:hypothetical protein RBB78_07105 [Tunturiibacter empetritectus]
MGIALVRELADAVGMMFSSGSSRFGLGGVLLWLALMVGFSVPAGGQTGAAAGQDVTQRPTSTPYSGDLSIFEYPDRDKKLQIDRVMDLLGIVAGKNVADIGAGSGWFTVRASRRVGPTGVVIAEDINPLAVEYIGKRAFKGRSVECADGAREPGRSAATLGQRGRGADAEGLSRDRAPCVDDEGAAKGFAAGG